MASNTISAEDLMTQVQQCLTPDAARKIAEYEFDAPTKARIEYLRGRCDEGTLTEAEQQEYEMIIRTMDRIGIIQSVARMFLRNLSA